MLILYESAVGYSLFRVLDADKLKNVDNIYREFSSKNKRSAFIQLHAFQAFKDMDEASSAAKCLGDGEKLHKSLSKMIKKNIIKKNLISDNLGVIDSKIGGLIKNKYNQLNIISNSSILELSRGIREHFTEFLTELSSTQTNAMNLGLSHLLSRHKIQFSAEKVDTMIIQAISLLDELDKEINIYAMRCKEWYGWHFPEMTRIVSDNIVYCRIINKIGKRKNIFNYDLSTIISDENIEIELKNIAKISMGSDITDSDLNNIQSLSEQVIELSNYRNELYEYLKNRMVAIAPNLTLMVGELVGARLLSHAGSLINLAKYPASTVQILGAEKALFRALKTKSDTPKYGLIYHASFVNAASQMNKAKIARTLACKTSLSARVDAFCTTTTATSNDNNLANELWIKMQKRINYVEGKSIQVKSKTLAGNIYVKHQFNDGDDDDDKYDQKDDFKIKKSKKRKLDDDDDANDNNNNNNNNNEPAKKKRKIDKSVVIKDEDDDDDGDNDDDDQDVDIADKDVDDDDKKEKKSKKKKKKKKDKKDKKDKKKKKKKIKQND